MGVTAQQPQQITTDYLHSGPTKMEPNNNVLKQNSFNSTLNAKAFRCMDVEDVTITDFYRDSHVFITGGTGFLGKCVIEKLIRTCDLVSKIYILIRPKRGLTPTQRLQELFKNHLFDKIREKDESLLLKIHPIEGDVTLPELGVSEQDKRILIENVDIVIHSAATVRFTETLKDAIIMNTYGTKSLLELSMLMPKLKSFVHVSTAYSNSDKTVVDEIVYEPPADPDHMIKCALTLTDEAMAKLEKELITQHPNTYTFTKALAETVVQDYSGKLPVAVVRPSIVTNAWKEPISGWIDHSTGVTGVMMEMGRGSVQTIFGKHDNLMDIVPVDIVTNTLIVAAWHTVAKRSNTMRVYNCTSGKINEMQWGRWSEMTVESAKKYPSQFISWYPQIHFTTSRLVQMFYVMIMQRGPACLADLLLMCQRRKPMMFNFCKRVERNVRVGEYFALNRFQFDCGNLDILKRDAKEVQDGEHFNLDMSKDSDFDWVKYNESCMLGIRQYVLKDEIKSLPQARRKLNSFYWLKRILQLVSFYVLLRMTFL